MPINLTNVYGKINNVRRTLFYDSEQTLKLYDVNDLLLEMETDWYMRLGTTSNLAIGAEYFELYIADLDEDKPLEQIIPMTSVIAIGNERYKIAQYERPRGLTQQWYLRLESTGMKRP